MQCSTDTAGCSPDEMPFDGLVLLWPEDPSIFLHKLPEDSEGAGVLRNVMLTLPDPGEIRKACHLDLLAGEGGAGKSQETTVQLHRWSLLHTILCATIWTPMSQS